LLAQAGGGSIVHIGSVSGQYGGPRTAHYAASKAGLISLAQVIARFGAQHGVRSNVVAAGLIASDMAARRWPRQRAEGRENILLKRLGARAGSGRRGRVPGKRRIVLHHGADAERQWRALFLMAKTLLIVSGGIEAADAAKRAKEMGLYVVVSDRDHGGARIRLCRFLPDRGCLWRRRNGRRRRTLQPQDPQASTA
jgi:NAD(P)-dependent dehydrogenase (short-subunit alcohol dehydrogenase family)